MNGTPLDYASLDLGDETKIQELLQEQIARGQQRRKKRMKPALAEMPPQLPMGLLGQASQIAAELTAMAGKCGQDRACWEAELAARRLKAMQSTEQGGNLPIQLSL